MWCRSIGHWALDRCYVLHGYHAFDGRVTHLLFFAPRDEHYMVQEHCTWNRSYILYE